MRLIDADALKEIELDFDTDDDCTLFCDAIDNAPTIEAEPVRHGEWEGNGLPASKLWHCSVCRRLTETAYYCDHCYYSYCPNCGAKMDKEESK